MTHGTVAEFTHDWQPVTPESGQLEQLTTGVHPIKERTDIAIAVMEMPRSYTVIARMCRHDLRNDLVGDNAGRVNSTTKVLACRHKRFSWCLNTGDNTGGAPDLPLYPSTVIDGILYVKLLTGSAA